MAQDTFEIICDECGENFESIDEYATLCPDCWQKIVSLNNEGKGDS